MEQISEESILTVLVQEGGKIQQMDLLNKFKGLLNCSDPAEKKQNRDLFKMIINHLAVVKDIEEVKHIVLRKKYHHLLTLSSDDGKEEKGGGKGGERGDQDRVKWEKEQREMNENESDDMKAQQSSSESEDDSSDRPSASSLVEKALQRHTSKDIRIKGPLRLVVPLKSSPDELQPGPVCSSSTESSTHEPSALPWRVPLRAMACGADQEIEQIRTPSDESPVRAHMAPVSSRPEPPHSPRCKRRSSVDIVTTSSSSQSRRHYKSAKSADEPKYGDTVPLESSEHEWMVLSASARWGLVYGLLLNDAQLAEKKDFISGFTALHWAAKCGNSEMLCKILDLSKKYSKGVDINAKSYAGYTPLHIAAIHGQEYLIGILVKECGADWNVRDNSGKKPHHYLHKDASLSVREMLGGLKVERVEPQKNTEDADTHRHTHTISRLFQPQTMGYKKKPKSRNLFLSVAEELKDEKAEHSKPMHRVLSDVFH